MPVEVTTAGSIVIIRFASPVDIPMDRWVEGALDYVSSARRDPDGSAIRLSLARRVRINTMAAGERTFIDFLPDSWTGAPPSLPIEVVRELAERARAAEKALRLQRAEAIAKKRPPIRVRALVQPTFVRFVFEMPDGVGASSVLNDGKLSLQFGGLLSFDLADAKIAAPPNIASINQKVEGDSTQVEIALIGDVDVHSFREEKNYIVDVGFQSDKPKESPLAEISRGAAKPAKGAGHSEEIKPPTSESIAKEMKAEARPEVAAPAVKDAAKSPPPSGARKDAAGGSREACRDGEARRHCGKAGSGRRAQGRQGTSCGRTQGAGCGCIEARSRSAEAAARRGSAEENGCSAAAGCEACRLHGRSTSGATAKACA